LATHDRESINLGHTLNKYYDKQILEFAHLLGMRESIYKNLENEKIHVYIPYREMIPYLFRRLYENMDTLKYIF